MSKEQVSLAEKAWWKRVGPLVQAYRLQKGMSVEQLAAAIQRDAKTVKVLEAGNRAMSPALLERVAACLGVPHDAIVMDPYPRQDPPVRRSPEWWQGFGHRISTGRRLKGWSVEQLAGTIGLAPSTLERLEAGNPGVSFANIRKLAVALDLAMDVLVGDVPLAPMPPPTLPPTPRFVPAPPPQRVPPPRVLPDQMPTEPVKAPTIWLVVYAAPAPRRADIPRPDPSAKIVEEFESLDDAGERVALLKSTDKSRDVTLYRAARLQYRVTVKVEE